MGYGKKDLKRGYFVRISRTPALDFIYEMNGTVTMGCTPFPFNQKRVYYLLSQRTPHWVACAMEHGPPKPGEVPVRLCGLSGCINGKHYKWGTQGEANSTRDVPGMSGEANPGAKVDRLLVAQIRSVNWRGGYYKWHVAQACGISMRTLAMILNGHTWKGIEPYRDAAEWAERNNDGDEF